ncbi:MAG: class I SAM-dependent methyltransferase [Gammaproteobacteria bacterium]|nr:class I SAM-dependent methyltransferase [Gammaproteobacteria bacterium]
MTTAPPGRGLHGPDDDAEIQAIASRAPWQETFEMNEHADIVGYYSHGGLLQRLQAALREDGIDPRQPTIEALSPYDQFHGRGLEATQAIADALTITSDDHILDIGSGIGGPARYMASRFACRITGIDLTAEFCEVARHLTEQMALADRVDIREANALSMPFADGLFEGAYSMNVAMNIADKRGFYAEIHRVLKPGGWLFLSEVAAGPAGEPDYPTPWARTAASSFLTTPEETLAGLRATGFEVIDHKERVQETLAFGERSRAALKRGEKAPHRAVQLIHGEIATRAMSNNARATAQGRAVPIEIHCRKP